MPESCPLCDNEVGRVAGHIRTNCPEANALRARLDARTPPSE